MEDPVAELDEAFALAAETSSRILRLIVDCADSKAWERDGATSTSRWLVQRYGLRFGVALELVRMARALRSLPRISEAHRLGRLSFDQLQPLVRFASAESDDHWAEIARRMSAAELWRERERHLRIDAATTRELQGARSAKIWWDELARMLHLEATLPPEQGAAVEKALNEGFERQPARDEQGDPVLPDQRLADALVEAVAGGAGPTAVVVHADAAVLTRDLPRNSPRTSEVDGRRVCTDSIRRLACDSRIEWALESEGRAVGVGRRGRTVPPHVLRLLRHRDDGSCRFPGCGHTRWLKAHHVRHWADGGPTNLENLILLCHHHHRLVHEGGWKVRGSPERTLEFRDPRGRPPGERPELARAG